MSRYLQSLKSQMMVFLHQLKSRHNGSVLFIEILVIIVGIDTVSCLLLFLLKRRKRWAGLLQILMLYLRKSPKNYYGSVLYNEMFSIYIFFTTLQEHFFFA